MRKLALLFPGQGSQEVGMGKEFYEGSPLAREMFARADEVLGYQLSKICFEGPEEDLKLTQNTQPALLVVSTIAFSLLQKKPAIAAGHSLGEYSALVASGGLKFEDAVALVHKRGKYMQEAVAVGVGAMAAVLGSRHEDVTVALARVQGGVAEIANWNSEEQIVIAGHEEAVKEALSLLNPPRSVFLPVSAPFHCRLMISAEEKLSHDLDDVEFKDLEFPIITNVDAKVIYRGADARDALKRQVTRPVLWYKSMEHLQDGDYDYVVELGSGRVLSGLIKRIGRAWTSAPTALSVSNPESLAKAQALLS
ncbi:MAG: ACP S-malonyltransferase [Candidatus Aminicenantes bacterium]|nr:ACP S-malonyltransferase [Candidatus Aminicenantes bacterium]